MFSMGIFLSIVFIQSYSEETFDCTGYEDDSFHLISNGHHCRYYWHCIYVNTVYMRAVKRICPAGTEFDIRLNQCEWAGSVNCVSIKSVDPPQTSRSTRTETTTRSAQFRVLPSNSSQLTSITYTLVQLLKNLIAVKLQSSSSSVYSTVESTTIPTTTTSPPSFFTSKLKRRHLIHRANLTLNILTSDDRKIRQFPLRQTHGILIHCNELRRRQLRDLIFRTPRTTTRINSSSKILFHSDILSLTMVLLFTKISD